MCASNTSRDGDGRSLDGRHLSEDELSLLIDGAFAGDERRQAMDHLAHCDQCRSTFDDLEILTRVLRELPQLEPPRSFQLDPSHRIARQSLWDRLGGALTPLLPAMRTATIVLALAFGGVTAIRIVDDQPASEPAREQFGTTTQAAPTDVIALEPTVSEPRDTADSAASGETSLKTGNDGSESDDAIDAPSDASAAEPRPGDMTSADEEAGASTQMQPPANGQTTAAGNRSGDSTADELAPVIAMEVADSPAASPTAAPSPAQTVEPTAIAMATPTTIAGPFGQAPASVDDRSWLTWAQVALGALLAVLGALLIGLTRFRRTL